MMWNMNDVISIKYQGGYTYYIEFDDGTQGQIDLSDYLEKGGVFEAFANLNFFKQAKIEGGTIAWANGLDIAPETIYNKLKP